MGRPKGSKNKKRFEMRARKRNVIPRPNRILTVGFPKTTMVKLRYVDHVTINPATGVLGQEFFRANSLYGPKVSSGGHQPNGYDQWRIFYNHYVVLGAKCTATFAKSGTASAGGMYVGGVSLVDDTTTSTKVSTLLEQSLSKRNIGFHSIDQGKPMKTFKTFSAKKFFNVTDVNDNIARLGALTTTSPLELAYFSIFVGDPNTTVDMAAVSVLVEIEYIVLFSEPKELAES